MIKSMTGYGRAEKVIDGRTITIEIKSVNHRYFELSSKVTRGYGFIEDKLKTYIQKRVSRGKIDVYVGIQSIDDKDVKVLISHSLASEYVYALRELKETYDLQGEVSLSNIIRYQDILTVSKTPDNEQEITKDVLQTLDLALDNFVAMREKEGESLKADISLRVAVILDLVKNVETALPKMIEDYQLRLRNRLEEVLENKDIDEQRILTEVAIFADKVDTNEETVRLRSHIDQLLNMLDSKVPVGRKMDFIVQEMNREANTIGSKSLNSQIAHRVVDIKAEIEKIREQIQNVE